MDDREKIKVKRRRKGDSPEGKPRAQAPSRRRTDETADERGLPPSQPTARKSTSPTGGIKLPIWLIIVAAILYFVFNSLTGGSEDTISVQESRPTEVINISIPTSTSKPVEIIKQPVSSEGQTWLVMLYQDADDQTLEKDILIDLNEAEKVGSTSRVTIVAQVDRYISGYSSDGNWTSTRRYYVKKDNDLNRIGSDLVQDLGEANMADGKVLVDFVVWAMQNFPADKYVLIMSDHGMGWPGGWSDPTSREKDSNIAPLASKLGDHLFLDEIDSALSEIRQRTNLEKFDIIGFDACLMAQLEVFTALESHAKYAIASEETEPSLGWAYTGFLEVLSQNTDISSSELSQIVVDSYIDEDQRIIDPVAREEFASQGSPLAALFGMGRATQEQLTLQLSRDITLSAVDLEVVPELIQKFNSFSYVLQDEDQSIVATARNYARSYTSIFGREVPPSFLDLGHFIQLIDRESNNSSVKEAANQVLEVLTRTIISEKHGNGKTGSSGISIYFPNSTLYGSPMAGPQSYSVIAERFSTVSLWDEFLAYHYQNRTFKIDQVGAYVPQTVTITRIPGQGVISVSDIQLSNDVASPGNPVDISVDIDGENIGYIKLLVGYYDQESNSIFIADTDYLESPDTYELEGIYYPKWGESGTFTIEFTWDPYIFAISDGQNLVPALFQPEVYGATSEDAVYSVEGNYYFVGSGETRYARLYFRDGMLQQVFGFAGQDETGAPHEIIPEIGDTFTILEQWMDFDNNGNVTGITSINGETLIFGEESLRWEEIYAAEGQYVIGFLVEDLDGNNYPVYTQVLVE